MKTEQKENKTGKTEEKSIYWSKDDTPIPKRGEILTNMFNEKYRIFSVIRRVDDIEISLRRIN